jgi:O-succinylbenzoate synthase
VDEAVARLTAIAPFGIEHVEQPVASLEEMVALRRRVGVLLAADELVSSPGAADALLDAGAADVLVVKPARVGGPPVAAAIARHAASHGVPVVVSNLLETGVGMTAALRVAAVVPMPSDGTEHRAHGLATAHLLVDDLVVGLPDIRDGAVELPLPADLGRPDDEAIRRFAVDSAGDPW